MLRKHIYLFANMYMGLYIYVMIDILVYIGVYTRVSMRSSHIRAYTIVSIDM